MPKSTRKSRPRKSAIDRPPKPYKDFPLCAANNGYWQKKILGRPHYFGRWGKVVDGKLQRIEGDTWQAALELYKAQVDDLMAGRKPRVKDDRLTVGELRGRFLTAKSRALDAGEITARTYAEYRATADRLLTLFGDKRPVDDLASDDFEELRANIAKQWGPVRLANEITRVKSVFRYAYLAGLTSQPVRYGPEFKKPSKAVLRKHRAKNGERMLEAHELRRVLDALEGKEVLTGRTDHETGKPIKVQVKANPTLRAMVLLGVNCGFNNKDCADLPLDALDLDGGWINFPRPKTGIARRCPLWAETVAAIRAAIEHRHQPKQEAAEKLVFTTTRGRPWLVRGIANPISVAARDLFKTVGVHREKIGFATLRHVFRTIADGSRDQVAVNSIMGHSDPTMAAVYRERIEDDRLRAVVDHVRSWLFAEPKTK